MRWLLDANVITNTARTIIMVVFCLLIVSGDFLTPFLIGGKITFIGNMIAPKFSLFYDWPLGSAMSFTMLTVSVLIIVLVSYLFKLTDPK